MDDAKLSKPRLFYNRFLFQLSAFVLLADIGFVCADHILLWSAASLSAPAAEYAAVIELALIFVGGPLLGSITIPLMPVSAVLCILSLASAMQMRGSTDPSLSTTLRFRMIEIVTYAGVPTSAIFFLSYLARMLVPI